MASSESKDAEDPNMPQVGKIVAYGSMGWNVKKHIYSGPFSDVYILADKNDETKKFAMKCERLKGNIRPVLKLDVLVLMGLKGTPGFPEFAASSRTDHYRYCVMQLVGPDLGKLRRSLPEKRFSTSTALRVIQQSLHRLEALHDAGWLCRDVKAPNFAIGLREENDVIYMLDFGFARKYKDGKGGILAPRTPPVALIGTFQYAPLASHSQIDQARKDDLESWLYMAVELIKGPLPWCRLNGHKEHTLMADWKRQVRKTGRTDFFDGVPQEFDSIMDHLDNLDYYERPNYNMMHGWIKEAATRLGFTLKEQFDWQDNKRLVRKAQFVGELGESNLASGKMEGSSDSLISDVTPNIDIDPIA